MATAVWSVPIKMRLTPSPSCQKLFQYTKYLQPGDSSAITFQNYYLALQLWSFCFTFSWCVFFCSHRRFPAWDLSLPIHAPCESVRLSRLLWNRSWRGSWLWPWLSTAEPTQGPGREPGGSTDKTRSSKVPQQRDPRGRRRIPQN